MRRRELADRGYRSIRDVRLIEWTGLKSGYRFNRRALRFALLARRPDGIFVAPFETGEIGPSPIRTQTRQRRRPSPLATEAFLILRVVIPATLIAGYPLLYPTYVVRYRLTANALVNRQPTAGSSVVEACVKLQPRLLDNPPWTFDIEGSFPAIDAGKRAYARALLARPLPDHSEGRVRSLRQPSFHGKQRNSRPHSWFRMDLTSSGGSLCPSRK